MQPLSSISSIAGRMLQEQLAVQDLPPAAPSSMPQHQWRSPDPHSYKANFDAAVFQATNTVGIGIIIRDSNGDVIGALFMPIPLSQSVAELEALAF